MQTHDEEREELLQQSKQWSDKPDEEFEDDLVGDVPTKAEIILCSVMRGEKGRHSYTFYLADSLNLPGPVGFAVDVLPNGHLKIRQSNPEAMLALATNEDGVVAGPLTEEEINRTYEEEHK